MSYSLRQQVGAVAIDWPRYEWGLRSSWLRIRNRGERLLASPDGRGVTCEWQWTSDLHAAKVFPHLGTRLMRRALREWSIAFGDSPNRIREPVQVSFIIGHRGVRRLPHLLATLATIAAQRDVACECIVVEQSERREIDSFLPSWVRYVHTPLPAAGMPYCRSWTLNVGARLARGELYVFHDNDMLVPEAYAAELWGRYGDGFEVINLKRFIFYLAEKHSREIASARRINFMLPPEAIVQNLEAGGSVAMARNAFFAIGGYDEGFVGWGGEDNEFWERAQTRRVWSYTYLPIVHLWHPAQPRKADPANPNLRHYRARSTIALQQRIAELNQRDFGDTDRLSVDWTFP